jgi:DNA-directed RNA polymerase subunit K/omega|tara:strand:+ start:620 stop:937 length:318 start_codon:yes stop_codon:yes gene_type:complete
MTNFNVVEKTESTYATFIKEYDTKKYMSKNIMTKYEKTSILGVRMEQLALGSPSTLDDDSLSTKKSVKEIAEEELKQNKIPLMISRTMPNLNEEIWKVEDLIIVS